MAIEPNNPINTSTQAPNEFGNIPIQTNSTIVQTPENTQRINYFPQTSGDLATWISAIGSLLVVVLALFGNKIHKILFKPSLEIVAGTDVPYFEKCIEKNTSNENGALQKYFGKIKIKIENKNPTTAESCKVFAQKIYSRKTDGRTYHPIKEFQPTTFLWLGENNKSNSRNIVCGIANYIEFAQIKMEEQLTSSVESSKTEDKKYRICLFIEDPEKEDTLMKLTPGTYLIPLTIHADNLAIPIIKYLYLYWNGNSPETLKNEDIEISIMSDREARENLKK